MNEKDLSIFYRPETNLERDYRSEAVVQHQLPDNRTEEEKIAQSSVQEIPDEIDAAIQNSVEAGNKLMRIRKITEVMPPRMKNTVDDFLDTIMIWIGVTVDELEKVKKEEPPEDEKHEIYQNGPIPKSATTKTEESVKEESEISIPDETETESEQPNDEQIEDEWPTMTSSGFVFDIVKNKDIWNMAHDQYLLESSAMQEDFADEYNNIMEGYVYQLVSAMDEIGLDMPEYLNYAYEGETVTGVPVNYQHLNDIIVKNQDVIDEYQDIFRKTHDLYTTDAILTAYDVASQKRIRYLKEQYKQETAGNYIEMYDKNYLADSRNEMEQNYIAARTNVYKLLHSMSQISKEMLAAQLKLAISKCSLLAKEVNIFAKKEYEAAEVSNTTAGDTKKSDNTDKKESDNTAKSAEKSSEKAAEGEVNPEKKKETKGQGT